MTVPQFLSIVEIRTKIVSMSTFSIAALHAFHTAGRISWLRLALMGIATLCVDMGTTAFNIYFDFRRGVDHSGHTIEQDKVLVHEGVAPGAAFLTAVSLFFMAVILGLIITVLTGWQVAAAGALCMVVGYLYTGGPHPISRTPFGELFAGGFLGTVLFLITRFVVSGYSEAGAFLQWTAAAASLPSFFLIASILTVNNTCDIEGDTAAGRRTLSIVVGRKAGRIIVYLLGALSFGSAAILATVRVLPPTLIPPIAAAAIISLFIYRSMDQRGFTHATKGPSMNSISRVFLLFTFAMWAGYLTAIFATS